MADTQKKKKKKKYSWIITALLLILLFVGAFGAGFGGYVAYHKWIRNKAAAPGENTEAAAPVDDTVIAAADAEAARTAYGEYFDQKAEEYATYADQSYDPYSTWLIPIDKNQDGTPEMMLFAWAGYTYEEEGAGQKIYACAYRDGKVHELLLASAQRNDDVLYVYVADDMKNLTTVHGMYGEDDYGYWVSQVRGKAFQYKGGRFQAGETLTEEADLAEYADQQVSEEFAQTYQPQSGYTRYVIYEDGEEYWSLGDFLDGLKELNIPISYGEEDSY